MMIYGGQFCQAMHTLPHESDVKYMSQILQLVYILHCTCFLIVWFPYCQSYIAKQKVGNILSCRQKETNTRPSIKAIWLSKPTWWDQIVDCSDESLAAQHEWTKAHSEKPKITGCWLHLHLEWQKDYGLNDNISSRRKGAKDIMDSPLRHMVLDYYQCINPRGKRLSTDILLL